MTEHVLLIEPDRILADQYQQALEAVDITVSRANDGHRAIAMIDKQLPAVVILELQLGTHNGIEFLYELRSYTDSAALPVVILSDVEPESVRQAIGYKQLQIAAHLYKPQTSLARLQQTIIDLIDSKPVK